MKKTLFALTTATALVCVAPVAFAKDVNPIFGKAAVTTTTTAENTKIRGLGYGADGITYAYYAYYYGYYGYYGYATSYAYSAYINFYYAQYYGY